MSVIGVNLETRSSYSYRSVLRIGRTKLIDSRNSWCLRFPFAFMLQGPIVSSLNPSAEKACETQNFDAKYRALVAESLYKIVVSSQHPE